MILNHYFATLFKHISYGKVKLYLIFNEQLWVILLIHFLNTYHLLYTNLQRFSCALHIPVLYFQQPFSELYRHLSFIIC